MVAWASLLIPGNVGNAKHNLAVTAEIVMYGYSEKPHKCHCLDIPHLQLHGEESEPIAGSLRETLHK